MEIIISVNKKNDKNNENSKPILYKDKVNGNTFAITGVVQKALIENKKYDKVKEFSQKAYECESYDALLQLTYQYVNWR